MPRHASMPNNISDSAEAKSIGDLYAAITMCDMYYEEQPSGFVDLLQKLTAGGNKLVAIINRTGKTVKDEIVWVLNQFKSHHKTLVMDDADDIIMVQQQLAFLSSYTRCANILLIMNKKRGIRRLPLHEICLHLYDAILVNNELAIKPIVQYYSVRSFNA